MSIFLLVLLAIIIFTIWLFIKLLRRLFRYFRKTLSNNNSEQVECPPCQFSNGISEEMFKEIVYQQAKFITKKRLSSISVDGSDVYGKVRSQSGISDWRFRIDFNDFGQITGRYWLHSDNDDSIIPQRLARQISSEVHNRI